MDVVFIKTMSAKSGKLQVSDEAIYANDVHGFAVLWVVFLILEISL